MMGIMILTFLFFFCFVVNVGMLVNAKINLQNAADLAAYAGAAVQARQLNTISYLNYEMRRQYKKFLFRYYIMGNLAEAQFPKNQASSYGHTPYLWSPNAFGVPPVNYQVPIVCMIFNMNDNYCQINQIPAIAMPPVQPYDSINQVLIQQLTQLEANRQNNCRQIAATNETILKLWLFNSDPTLQKLVNNPGFPPDEQGQLNLISGIAQGLGLIPRELLLKRRIDTVQSYVNSSPNQGVTLDQVQSLQKSPDPWANERTIDAFLSAYYTLGTGNFPDASQISMDELLPQGDTNLLDLKEIPASFDTYAIWYDTTDPGSGASVQNIGGNIVPLNCTPKLQPVSIRKVVLGVYKNPKTLTYYAVRLRATAHLLFSPWGDVELTAYAAARPFGSRIGPVLQPSDLTWPNIKPAMLGITGSNGNANINLMQAIPNLPIAAPTDNTTNGFGWASKEVLGTMLQQGFPLAASNPNTQVTSTMMNKAYQIAMAPNPYESANYNIPNDLPGESTHLPNNFDSNGRMTLWAPITSPANPGAATADLQNALNDILPPADAVDPNSQSLRRALANDIGNYVQQLQSGTPGENGETMNTVQLGDPFNIHVSSAPPQPIQLPNWLMIQKQEDAMTSWNYANDAADHPKNPRVGRLGYSVKFVSFASLLNPTEVDSSGATATNVVQGVDAMTDSDLAVLQH